MRADGSVVTWGNGGSGGNSSAVAALLDGTTAVTQIYSTIYAFAALRIDGSVVTWGGYGGFGGDSSAVAADIDGATDVTQIYSTSYDFAALRADGSVVTWGEFGSYSSTVAAMLDGTTDVKQIYSTDASFAALRVDGSVVTWGSDFVGGDSSAVAALLDGTTDVTQVYSTLGAFAALRADGSVVTWGYESQGGDSSAVAALLDGTIDVTQIYSTDYAFAALRADGSVVTWGHYLTGGDSGVVASLISSGVVSGADISTNDVVAFFPSLTLNGTSGDDTLIGRAGDDTLNGFAGNDTLNGGAGLDTMTGGLGNDLYTVDNVGDRVVENSNEGTDTVKSSVTYALAANVENLTLTGTTAINGTGNELANELTGNSAANALVGGDGNDTLNGGADADTLTGGLANDLYIVDNVADSVIENVGEGTDTVISSVTYTLAANIERLTLTDADNINGTGNALGNTLIGNAANNVLNGGAGADVLKGGLGSDTFIFSTTVGGVDRVTDFVSGTDKLQFLDGLAGIKIGNSDHIIDNAALINTKGGFSKLAELVVVTPNIVGTITTAKAAANIGSAASAYAVGDSRLFVVDNGADTVFYQFKSAGNDAVVSTVELTLLGSLQGVAQTALADFSFA